MLLAVARLSGGRAPRDTLRAKRHAARTSPQDPAERLDRADGRGPRAQGDRQGLVVGAAAQDQRRPQRVGGRRERRRADVGAEHRLQLQQPFGGRVQQHERAGEPLGRVAGERAQLRHRSSRGLAGRCAAQAGAQLGLPHARLFELELPLAHPRVQLALGVVVHRYSVLRLGQRGAELRRQRDGIRIDPDQPGRDPGLHELNEHVFGLIQQAGASHIQGVDGHRKPVSSEGSLSLGGASSPSSFLGRGATADRSSATSRLGIFTLCLSSTSSWMRSSSSSI
jgi:hypothetical protein